jgi:hypothetical protein
MKVRMKIMLRLTALRISFLSALATLVLLVGLLVSTGTASAHTASAQAPAFPHINAYGTYPVGGGCEVTHLVGFGFAPGPVHLVALRYGHPLFVHPGVIFTGGSFSRTVVVCGGYGYGIHHAVLFAVGPYGFHSNPVFL